MIPGLIFFKNKLSGHLSWLIHKFCLILHVDVKKRWWNELSVKSKRRTQHKIIKIKTNLEKDVHILFGIYSFISYV